MSLLLRIAWLSHRIRRWWRRQRRPKRTVEEQNIWNLYLDIAWFGVLSGVVNTFTRVFAIHLDASNTMVGLLTSAPALINILWLTPAARIVEGQQSHMPLVLSAGFLQRLSYLFIALMPSMIRSHRPEALVVLVTLTALPSALSSLAFTSLLADAVPQRRRAEVIGVRHFLSGISSAIAVLIGGKLLDLIPFPLNHQSLFFIGFLASLISLRYVSRIQAPRIVTAPKARPSLSPAELWKLADNNRNFVRFTLSSFVFHWGLFLPAALYPIYWVKHLHASDSWIGLMATFSDATAVLAYLLWGKVTARRGNRPVLFVSTLGLVLYPVLTGLSPSVEPLLLVAIVGGTFAAGVNLALYNTLLEVCPQERQPIFVALYTALTNVAGFLSPMLGTALADHQGIVKALFIAGALRLLGSILFYRL